MARVCACRFACPSSRPSTRSAGPAACRATSTPSSGDRCASRTAAENPEHARATQRVALFVARTHNRETPHRPPPGDARPEQAIATDPRPRLREKGSFVARRTFRQCNRCRDGSCRHFPTVTRSDPGSSTPPRRTSRPPRRSRAEGWASGADIAKRKARPRLAVGERHPAGAGSRRAQVRVLPARPRRDVAAAGRNGPVLDILEVVAGSSPARRPRAPVAQPAERRRSVTPRPQQPPHAPPRAEAAPVRRRARHDRGTTTHTTRPRKGGVHMPHLKRHRTRHVPQQIPIPRSGQAPGSAGGHRRAHRRLDAAAPLPRPRLRARLLPRVRMDAHARERAGARALHPRGRPAGRRRDRPRQRRGPGAAQRPGALRPGDGGRPRGRRHARGRARRTPAGRADSRAPVPVRGLRRRVPGLGPFAAPRRRALVRGAACRGARLPGRHVTAGARA